ncbi:serine--tRNA ligase [Candidatus Daviesbacteria bacterium RIFOXYD1_FULL_41_10]|uniref:Serine--tRNA ligase n=3 Tax=Bacteria candidate phyla TaxID=1783234 RepID=A0A0G0FXD8_9BACT|nr:MAG: Serine-tRNA ligase [Berkelbacteria bacterium GW2011_GWA1_36_9]KKQ76549.1 MAG: Serine-tRNA ligase [Parcubacteria group bacterium GW2011_GWC1_38_6]KKS14000.1 MAG: Serine-tRNA ligase [Candidatus Daviesbacteria bacterium GW2011_GWB1_41_5]OGE71408.1 MAG: serine--tRNA ligase [Candidatus Daviesbacteria bacterium RIFOXYD1_FULL_41_10]
MLDINFIRENVDLVKQAVINKNFDIDIDALLDLDKKRREMVAEIEKLREQRNIISKEKNIEKGREIKEKLDGLEPRLREIDKQLYNLMILVPNVPLSDVLVGKNESENKPIRKWGEPRQFDFPIKDHIELGNLLDLIDTETAAKITGSRFTYLKNEAVMLQFAIIQFTFEILQNKEIIRKLAQQIDANLSDKIFIPVLPPVMIKPEPYTRMARLDKNQAEERYYLPSDDLYLIGSAEHTLGPMYMDQTLDESMFPLRYVGYSTSFRREAGSYGKDVKGILRVHQFDKIEIESFTLPENGAKEQELIVAIQEYLMQSLGLPYQVVAICTGDMGGPDARQFDIETWMPGQDRYRETHTSDYMTDYQSRRLNTKVKRKDGKSEFVHMNDATAFAIGRILIAILENFQQKDGSVKIPEVLQKYTGFSEIKLRK